MVSKIRLATAASLTLVLGVVSGTSPSVQAQTSRGTVQPLGRINTFNLSAQSTTRAGTRLIHRPLPRVPHQSTPLPLTVPSSSVPKANAIDLSRSEPKAPLVAATLRTKFDSIRSSVLEPPDPHLAVGPTDLLASTNAGFQIYKKTGAKVGGLLNPEAFFLVSSSYNITADPKFLYDAESGRFFGVYIGFDFRNNRGSWFVAVSTDNTAAGNWIVYRIDESGVFPDYPGLGVCSNKLVVTANNFANATSLTDAAAVALNKSQMVAGATTFFNLFRNLKLNSGDLAFTVQPAHSLTSTSTCHMAAMNSSTGNRVQMYKVNGLPSSTSNATLTTGASVPITAVSSPPAAVQKGSTKRIDAGNIDLLDATYRGVNGGSLWVSSTTGCNVGTGTLTSCINLVELKNVNTNPALRQQIIYGAPNLFYYYPALRTDRNNNMTVVFGRSGSSEFPSIRYTSHLNSAPLGTFKPSVLLKAGSTFSTGCCTAGQLGRWGDYFGAALDPFNTSAIWIYGEYKPTSSPAQWGTFVGKTTIP